MSRLIVKNLPSHLDESKLRNVFSKHGKVTDCKIIHKKEGRGQSRRFAFVGFHQSEEAEAARVALNDSFILKQRINVELCRKLTEADKKFSKKSSAAKGKGNKKNRTDFGEKITEGFWVKMRGCPFKVTDKEITEFFYPTALKTIRIGKNESGSKTGIVLVEVNSDKDLVDAMKNDKAYLNNRYIELQKFEHYDDSSAKSGGKPAADAAKNRNYGDTNIDISETGRLFVRNLSFTCTEALLEDHMQTYGLVNECSIKLDPETQESLGYGFVTFAMPADAMKALGELDGTVFQGRMLHVLPGKPKKDDIDERYKDQSTGFKQKRFEEQQAAAESTHNWNTLFIGVNAVTDAIAEKYSVEKRDVMASSRDQSAAVRVALAETEIVQETKSFFKKHNISIEAFERPNGEKRPNSKTVIIAKNLSSNTTSGEIREKFNKFGELKRVLLAPAGTTAIVEYALPSCAKNGFMKCAYRAIHHKPLLLEWAPEDVFTKPTEKPAPMTIKEKVAADIKAEAERPKVVASKNGTMRLFVKSINFETPVETLREHFEQCGPLLDCRIVQDFRNQVYLSKGYGFVEFADKEHGMKCLKELQGVELEGYKLELSISTKLKEAGKTQVVGKRGSDGTEENDVGKLIVRNIAFNARKEEIQSMFGHFGTIKDLRLPMKDGFQHKGYCFVDFLAKADARKALEALGDSTHFYGKRLVIDWAKDDGTNVNHLRRKATKQAHGLAKKVKSSLGAFQDGLANQNNDDSD